MRRRHLESVSAAPYRRCFRIVRIQPQLSVRGSWGTAPSVFWNGAPGGTQGPPGKGGAAERWRVTPSVSWVTRHGAQPATTRTYKSRPRRVGVQTKTFYKTPRRRRRPQTWPQNTTINPRYNYPEKSIIYTNLTQYFPTL